MKSEYKIYCRKHAEELQIYETDSTINGDVNSTSFEVGQCQQCQSEAYEKGIESLLSKGYSKEAGL